MTTPTTTATTTTTTLPPTSPTAPRARRRASWLLVLLALLTAPALPGCDDEDGGSGSDAALVDEIVSSNGRTSACLGDDLGSALGILPVATAARGALREDLEAIAQCVEAASDCAEVVRCIGLDPAQPCEVATYEKRCEGSAQLVCERIDDEGNGFVRRIDCADDLSGNTQCGAALGNTYCHAGSCSGAGAEGCEGDVARNCTLGVASRVDCSLLGLTCLDDTTEGLRCGEAGSSCTADACDGATLVSCSDGAVVSRFDCTLLSAEHTCVADTQGPRCSVPSEQLACEGSEQRCEGSVGRVCVGGAWIDRDCADFLDGSCVVEGADAHCRVPGWP